MRIMIIGIPYLKCMCQYNECGSNSSKESPKECPKTLGKSKIREELCGMAVGMNKKMLQPTRLSRTPHFKPTFQHDIFDNF
jgi:hypothetical protein